MFAKFLFVDLEEKRNVFTRKRKTWPELHTCQEQGQDQVHPRPEVQCISRQDAALLEGLLQCTTHSNGDLILNSERPRMG